MNSLQLKTVMKLVAEAHRLTQRHAPEDLAIWKADPWISLEVELANCQRFKSAPGLRQMCKQIIGAIQSPGPSSTTKQNKRKVTNAQHDLGKRETKRKKVIGDV